MSSEIAIKVENLSKCYQIYDQPRDRLKQFVLPRMQSLVGLPPKQYYREFWALKDVSFEVKKGEVVGLLGDRDFTAQKDRIDFFGKPARLPRGPAWLSIKTGAPILVGFVLRQVDDSFVVRMYPPILPEKEGSEDAIRIKIRDLLETCVGEYPYQWFIFDDFWADAGTSAVGGKTT